MLKYLKQRLTRSYLGQFYAKYRDINTYKKKYALFLDDLADFEKFSSSAVSRFGTDKISLNPELDDKISNTPIEPHYTYHPAWAARILAQTKPVKHVDISSTLHFCTIVSAFVPVDFYDYRPANLRLDNLNSDHADLTKLFFGDNSIQSLSCMHTIEHIGLGRYGDTIDYDGDIKAIGELKRVLAPNGDLLIVTPTGKPKIEFNAHRIYSHDQIIEYFSPLKLMEFSLVPDQFENTGIVRNATKELADKQDWGCGCFWFKKI